MQPKAITDETSTIMEHYLFVVIQRQLQSDRYGVTITSFIHHKGLSLTPSVHFHWCSGATKTPNTKSPGKKWGTQLTHHQIPATLYHEKHGLPSSKCVRWSTMASWNPLVQIHVGTMKGPAGPFIVIIHHAKAARGHIIGGILRSVYHMRGIIEAV